MQNFAQKIQIKRRKIPKDFFELLRCGRIVSWDFTSL